MPNSQNFWLYKTLKSKKKKSLRGLCWVRQWPHVTIRWITGGVSTGREKTRRKTFGTNGRSSPSRLKHVLFCYFTNISLTSFYLKVVSIIVFEHHISQISGVLLLTLASKVVPKNKYTILKHLEFISPTTIQPLFSKHLEFLSLGSKDVLKYSTNLKHPK